jgi:hypothetical protein
VLFYFRALLFSRSFIFALFYFALL